MDPKVMEIDPVNQSMRPLRDMLAQAAIARGAAPQQPDAPFANAPNPYSQLYEGDLAQSYMQPVQQPPSSFANVLMGLLGQATQAPNPNANGTSTGYRPPQGFNGVNPTGGDNSARTGRTYQLQQNPYQPGQGPGPANTTPAPPSADTLRMSDPMSAVDEMLNWDLPWDYNTLPDVPPDMMSIMGISPVGMSKSQFYDLFIPKMMQHKQDSEKAAKEQLMKDPRFSQGNSPAIDPGTMTRNGQGFFVPPATMPPITSGSRSMNSINSEINPPGMSREKKVG
jgi:hypothetical protein